MPSLPAGFEGVWHEAEHSERLGPCVVFDSRRGRLIEFGGGGGWGVVASLWSYDPRGPQRWSPIVALGEAPSPRRRAAAVYDSLDDRIIVFGGAAGRELQPYSSEAVGDLWELRLGGLPRWRRLDATGMAPSPREGAGVAFDSKRRRLILIGGGRHVWNDFEGNPIYSYANDVWALRLDGVPSWERLALSGAPPPPAMGFGATYDSDHDAIVLMGGYTLGGINFGNGLTYSNVWSLPLAGSPAWSLMGPEKLPHPHGVYYPSPSLVYDPLRHRVVVFSGRDSITMAFQLGAPDLWTPLGTGDHGPGYRYEQGMVLAPDSNEILVTGGYNGQDVWRLPLSDGATWRREDLSPDVPGSLSGSTLTADPKRGRVILCGGSRTVRVNRRDLVIPVDEVWAFSTNEERWSRLEGVHIPRGGLSSHHAIVDPRRERLLLFGGSAPGDSAGILIPNAFAYSTSLERPSVWDERAVGGFPPDLGAAPSAVLDEASDRLLLQGGGSFENSQSPPPAVWMLPLAGDMRFQPLVVLGEGPPNAYGSSAIYDPLRRRTIVQVDANRFFDHALGALWAVDLAGAPTWSRLVTTGTSPVTRIRQFAAYDTAKDRILMFGGSASRDLRTYWGTNDAWALSLDGSPVWDSLEVQGPRPYPWSAASVAFDARARKLVGARGGYFSGIVDTYVLDLLPPTRQVDLLVTREGRTGHLRPGSRGELPIAILSEPAFDARRLDPATLRLDQAPVAKRGRRWKTREVDANEDGLMDLECRFVPRRGPRDRGDELLTITGFDPEGFPLYGETVAGVRENVSSEIGEGGTEREADSDSDIAPSRGAPLEFELRGVEPNPSIDGRLRVRFTLPSAEPATIELLDLGGRRVERREERTAMGTHLVQLGSQSRLAPGLYWVRLRQGARSATTRAVVLR